MKDLSDPKDLLAPVVELAKRAGEQILEVYERDIEVMSKGDRSPLTAADLRSHATIVAGLNTLTPQLPVLSEEGADIPFDERSRWNRYWLVDPLDGTKEFLSRNGEFTVNIALIENHRAVLGVVHVPVQAATYAGSVNAGAQRQKGTEAPVQIRVCSPAPPKLRVVGSRSHAVEALDAHLPKLGPHELVRIGSSLKFCLVAEGSADLYPRFGPTSEWDTAAAHAVLDAAGGAVLTAAGEPLRYNAKADLLNPHFIAFGDKTRDWRALLGRAGK